MAEPRGLRERTRRAVRAEISNTAVRLFLESGFEAVTMAQIARAVGISRRSLFRYFGTKEDIVLGDLAELGRASRARLAERPASEPPWAALRAAFEVVVRDPSGSAEGAYRIARLVHDTPSLRARRLEKHLAWRDELVPAIERRLTGEDAHVRAHALVSAALACLDSATESWLRRAGRGEIQVLYDEAVAAIRSTR